MKFSSISSHRGVLATGVALSLSLSLAACGGAAAPEADGAASTELDPASLAGMLGKTCGEDIAKLCSQVLPGDGRVQACLYAHQDLISDSCFEATAQSSIMLERMFDRFTGFYNACNVDLNTHCADIDAGSGAQIACLAEKLDEISEPCRERVPNLVAAVADDPE